MAFSVRTILEKIERATIRKVTHEVEPERAVSLAALEEQNAAGKLTSRSQTTQPN